MASGTSISILYLVAKEIRKKEEKVDAYLDLLNSFFYFFCRISYPLMVKNYDISLRNLAVAQR